MERHLGCSGSRALFLIGKGIEQGTLEHVGYKRAVKITGDLLPVPCYRLVRKKKR